MDSSACFERGRSGLCRAVMTSSSCALVLVGLTLASCSSQRAATPSSSEAFANSFEGGEDSQARAVDVALNSSQAEMAPVTVRVLLEKSEAAPGISLIEGEAFSKIVVPGQFHEGDFKVSKFSDPERIVVDLFAASSRFNRSFPGDEGRFVTNVRLGAHPDKSRIVLDLNSAAAPSYETRITEQGLEIAVGQADGLASAFSLPRSDGMAEPRMDLLLDQGQLEQAELVDEGTSADLIDSEASINSAVPVAPVEVVAEAQAAAPQSVALSESASAEQISDVSPRLTGMSLEEINGGQNALIANITSAGAFTLTRTAPSEYVLKLEDATLAPEAAMTIMGVPGSSPIRSVRPVAQGSDVLLRLFVAPEATLEARPMSAANGSGDTRLFVAASQGGAYEKIMAQQKDPAAPAAVEEGAPTADTTTAASPTASGQEDPDVAGLLSETPVWTGRLISLDLQDTDIDNALRIIAEVSNLNIIASDDVTGKVTLRLIDVPWDQALDVILKTNGLDKVQEGNVVRIAPVEKLRQERESLKQAKQAEEELEALSVKYVRISYGRAAELKPLVETVLSERGSVAYDERTNQLIVKDIKKGIKNVAELVAKVDLRTPQVLLETQIVEAKRGLLRDLGASFGYNYVRSPELGNATGYNFPNSIDFGATTDFLGPQDATMSLVFGSADGSQDLNLKLSAYEQEGRVRVVSRPAVATTNNKQATIKSVEKIRVKLPGGGTSVATGQGASASGSSTSATETIEIGIELQVTPQASPDYYVLLDLKAKSSTFGDKIVEGIPSEVERSANSTVLVSSGQTFAMGGIYKTNDFTTDTGVPFLKDIPVIGTLFRDVRVDNSDEELLFFITPRIIEGSFDDAAMKASV